MKNQFSHRQEKYETQSFSSKKEKKIEKKPDNQNFSNILKKLPDFENLKESSALAHTACMLKMKANKNYLLLDSGYGFKFEKFGPYKIIRPDGQAFWQPRLSKEDWRKADAFFTGNLKEEGAGRWEFLKKPLAQGWDMSWKNLSFQARFTSFRHVGIFPEQDPHWRFIEKAIKKSPRPVSVLNLFGYTGIASIIAAEAGAKVTHIDASKKAIQWARLNQEMSSLDEKPIRWICEDALTFVLREKKRGKKYDIILLDPPSYGRGPQGEVWQLFDHLPILLKNCSSLLSEKAIALILTAYSIRSSFFSLHNLMLESLSSRSGSIHSGELLIDEEPISNKPMRTLSTSLFSRWHYE